MRFAGRGGALGSGGSVGGAMAGGERGRGPLWRVRRRWARMGLLARIAAVSIGVLIAFVALGAGLEACSPSDDGPRQPLPATTAPGASTPPTGSPETPPASDSEVPEPPAETVRETVTEAQSTTAEPETSSPAPDVYYDNCDEARAAGAAPLFVGEPGYRPELDRNRDGVACEE
ncbi:excalibur calcium-binding domain-containing protein [Streptomyces luteogriseus]|uniref:excalibur calcium-binding domain-containing protein n=1 Tax=Streptomyces luteogriseus TaxID=68233 RepID=UPI003794455E